ncbi:MAG: ABC transporter permease subunit [Opitutales bacterium]|nr:ABC transporter permease subunit [Opitutales bacterium]
MRLNPLTVKKLKRFRSIRRGYWSLIILGVFFALTLCGELLVNNKALLVSYDGHWHFPIFHSGIYTGEDFGLDYKSEARYRELDDFFERIGSDNFVIMPLVPYGPLEQDFRAGEYPPNPPSFERQHYLGTDSLARDVLARLFYGFRVAMLFSLAFVAISFAIGIATGCAMGYFGGITDLAGQRFMEIWSNIPLLYLVIIMRSLMPAGASTTMRITTLLLIMCAFSWVGMAYLMRTATYREKAREYVDASRVLGAGTFRILFKHILPNTVSIVVTFIPFMAASGITALTALDFLGFGLPPPTPSWGELLEQGTQRMDAPWIVTSTFVVMVTVLTLVAFVGEAIREAYDPRKFSTYQ